MKAPLLFRWLGCLAAVLLAHSVFAQASTIQGEVKGVDGRVAQRAEVRIQPARGQLAPIIVKTDARGRFVANNIAPGPYNIAAVGPGGVSSPVQAIKVQANKPLTVAFDLRNTTAAKTAAKGKKKTKFVWVPAETGSHLGGHWIEVDDDASAQPSAQHVETMNKKAVERMQNSGFQRGITGGGSP